MTRRAVIRCLLVCAVGCVCAGCCTHRLRSFRPVRDHLNAYVLIGVQPLPKCLTPPDQRIAVEVGIGERQAIWVRAVLRDDLRSGLTGLPVSLRAIDEFGDDVDAEITPNDVSTGSDGFAVGAISFMAKAAGVYRIVATFPDRRMTSTSFSQPLIAVLRPTTRASALANCRSL